MISAAATSKLSLKVMNTRKSALIYQT